MRVLVTSDTYFPILGGGEHHVYYLIRSLEDEGMDVHFVTTQKGVHDADSEISMDRVPYTGLFSLPRIAWTMWKASKGVDIIHGHYSYRLSFVAAVVAFLRRIPFVVTQHGLGLLPQAGAKLWQELPFRLWRYWSMKIARVVVSTSEDLSVDIRALGFGDKIVPIPNGYDPSRFSPLPFIEAQDTPVLLAVRRLNPKNGIQYLVAALPDVVARYPGLRCDLVGEGPWKERIERLAHELGVEKHVRFLGAVGHKDIRALYEEAHVVLLPSTAESTSLSCIEAMAQRKTVVASRVGGLIELLGAHEERGYLVNLTEDEHCNYDAPFSLPPERIKRLSDAILHVLMHPNEAEEKAQAAADYAKKQYAWNELVKRLIADVYSPLVS